MKKMGKKLLLIGVAAALTASLAGCDALGDNMIKDSQTYIQGQLDELYLGQYNKDYLELIDMTEEEAKAEHDDWAAMEAENFIYYFSLEDATDDFKARVAQMYMDEIYPKAKYTVKGCSKLESGAYAVEVEVEPLLLMGLVTVADMQAAYEALTSDEALAGYDFDNMSDEDYNALLDQINQQYNEDILTLVKAQLPNISYGPAQPIVVQLKEETENVFAMVDGDLQQLDSYIVDYPAE